MAADARTRIGALSGGQRRRVDLGIAIIGHPEMLFLDEPTTGLDPEARRRLWSVIENLTASGTGVLLTTHYLDEAQRLASRVVVLADGRVVADASPDKLRAMGGVPVIRYRLPAGAPDLPAGLAGHVADGELTLPSADVTADLDLLTGWARANHVDLTGLRSGRPAWRTPTWPSPARKEQRTMVSDGTMVAGQVRYQLTLMLRTPRTLMAGLILPGALLALQLGRVQHLGQGAAADVLAARVAGLVVLGAMSVAYLSHASSLVVAREDGVLRRWRATPLPSWGYFAGRIIATVLLADAAALILVLVGVAMAGLHLTAGAIGGLLLAGSLGALALAAAGTAVTPLLTSAQGANPLLTLTYLPLIIFSGGFGGLSGLPHWLNTLMSYLPAQPMIDAVTRALQPSAGMSGRDLAVLAAWALGGLLLSVRFFRWDPSRPRHARTAGAATRPVRDKNASGGPASRPPPARPAAGRPRRGGPRARPRRPAARASARS